MLKHLTKKQKLAGFGGKRVQAAEKAALKRSRSKVSKAAKKPVKKASGPKTKTVLAALGGAAAGGLAGYALGNPALFTNAVQNAQTTASTLASQVANFFGIGNPAGAATPPTPAAAPAPVLISAYSVPPAAPPDQINTVTVPETYSAINQQQYDAYGLGTDWNM